ncbi:MAG TPA: hypothetical protein VIL46_00545, partial [Gemmataceae bacterium]
LGVGAAVRALLGSLPPAGGAALELGRRILAEVREAAAQDRRRSLEFGLVVPAGEEWVASDPRRQVRVAAALHAEAPGALAELVLTGDPEACAGEAFDLLRECWAADLGRVRLALVPATA